MPRLRTTELTDDLHRRLSGDDVDSLAALAIVVCTVDAGGFPHPAILSYFEVVAADRQNLRLAIYNDSRTCANMRERGKAVLILVDRNLVCYVRGIASELAPTMASAPFNALLNLRVQDVTFDEAPPDLEPGAFVTSGITYRSRTGQPLALARAILAELRTSASELG
jgi:hypothetical protein